MSGDSFLVKEKFKLNQPVEIIISHHARTPIEVDLVLIDKRNEANRSWYYQKYQFYHYFYTLNAN